MTNAVTDTRLTTYWFNDNCSKIPQIDVNFIQTNDELHLLTTTNY